MNNSAIIETIPVDKEISTKTLFNAAIDIGNNNNFIYVCSPLKPYGKYTLEDNIKQAQFYCRELALKGEHPLSPSVYFTSFLDDCNQYERELGFTLGLKWLFLCNRMNCYIRNGYISDGMKKEIDLAEKMEIIINYAYET